MQGVGFRPAVYQLAKRLGLRGYVRNMSEGVEVVIEGKRAGEFKEMFLKNLPPLARVDFVKEEEIDTQRFEDFTIIKSEGGKKETFLSPDISICDDCLKDLFDSANRRYLYPLINCTNCGSRYTIIKELPYDRKNTSMSEFKMCKECRREYEDAHSRFYHAQPISCFRCGPKVRFKDLTQNEAIKEAAKELCEGKILAIKGVGGYHLVCKATDKEAIKTLRERKKRLRKPFAVMFRDLEQIKEYCLMDKTQESLVLSKERPIVVAKSKKELEGVAPGIGRIGVFLPYSPLYNLLFKFLDFPIVATSANISEEPIIKDEAGIKRLNIHDEILWYDREIVRSCDDSVVTSADGKPLFYRLGRGYGPKSYIYKEMPSVLAVGARQKNTIALGFSKNIILSPHIGDIKNIESFEYFKKVIDDFKLIYDFEPDVVVCDMHPGYETTRYAKTLSKDVVQVQHHRAHIYAALAELELEWNKELNEWCGFSFDGTGYGEDGKIWGGEVFVGDKRAYHFDYWKICGGEKAIKDIRLQGWSLLKSLKEGVANPLFETAYEKSINCFETSSAGRLFDAVAYLGGICEKVDYEGEAGVLMEKRYRGWDFGHYPFVIDGKKIKIDFKALLSDKKEMVATRFINTIASIVLYIAKKEQKSVILTGGVFQNRTLLNLCASLFKKEGIDYFFPSKTPINDGAISLGQLWWVVKKRGEK